MNYLSRALLGTLIMISVASFGINLAFAQSVGAGALFRFGQDARALGMGGAFVAIANNYSAPYWNPAGIGIARGSRLGGMYTNPYQLEDLNLSSIGGRTMIKEIGLGGTYTNFSTSYLSTQEGAVQEIATYSENLYTVTVASQFEGIGLVGGSIKYYSFAAPGGGVRGGTASAQGLGFDLGILRALKDLPATLAISVLDFDNTSIKWKGTPTGSVNTIPAIYKLGAAYRWDSLDLIGAFGYDFTNGKNNKSNVIRFGVEYKPVSQLAIRAGAVKPADRDIYYTVGAGVSMRSLNLDCAWVENRTNLRDVVEEGTGDTIILSTEFKL